MYHILPSIKSNVNTFDFIDVFLMLFVALHMDLILKFLKSRDYPSYKANTGKATVET